MTLRATIFAKFFCVSENAIADIRKIHGYIGQEYMNDIGRIYLAVIRTLLTRVPRRLIASIFFFGAGISAFADTFLPRVFTDAGEPFPREFRK